MEQKEYRLAAIMYTDIAGFSRMMEENESGTLETLRRHNQLITDSVTKHGAVAFSEWLAVTYGTQGLKVSCLCPMGVNTPFIKSAEEFEPLLGPYAIEPEQVADAVVAGLASESFLILPHPEVEKFFQNKANDYDRWIVGMQNLQSTVFPT